MSTNNNRSRIWGLLENIEKTGLFVFFVAGMATVALLLIMFALPTERSSEAFRAVQLSLTLAATALVISLIAKSSRNSFVIVFGLFLVGALIVPTNDIIRFALVASGSDRSISDFLISPRGGTTKPRDARSGDLAVLLFDDLLRSDYIDVQQRSDIVRLISNRLASDQIGQALSEVKQRDAYDLLKAIESNEYLSFRYRHFQNQKFMDDLLYLHQEDIISIAYDDYDTVALTDFGRSMFPGESVETDECPSLGSVGDNGAYTQSLYLGPGAVCRSFMVEEDGLYAIQVGLDSFVDTVISLDRADSDGESNRQTVGEDDDGGCFQDSLLLVDLMSQYRYFLTIRSFGGGEEGQVDVLIEEYESSRDPCR